MDFRYVQVDDGEGRQLDVHVDVDGRVVFELSKNVEDDIRYIAMPLSNTPNNVGELTILRDMLTDWINNG